MLKNGSHECSRPPGPRGWGRGAAVGDSPERPPWSGVGPVTAVLTTPAACGPGELFSLTKAGDLDFLSSAGEENAR